MPRTTDSDSPVAPEPSTDPNLGGHEALQAEERAKLRQLKTGTLALKVRVVGGVKTFRRAGVEFSGEAPTIVNVKDLSPAQRIEILNTPVLDVEELTSESKDAATVPPRASLARGGGPDPAALRGPGDAPVPTSDGAPGGHPAATLPSVPSRPAPPADRDTMPGKPRDRG